MELTREQIEELRYVASERTRDRNGNLHNDSINALCDMAEKWRSLAAEEAPVSPEYRALHALCEDQEKTIKELRALQAIPGDSVCVPREPTDRMCVNGSAVFGWVGAENDLKVAAQVYRAMLSAAPAPARREDTRDDDLEYFIAAVNTLRGVFAFPDDVAAFWTTINKRAAPPIDVNGGEKG